MKLQEDITEIILGTLSISFGGIAYFAQTELPTWAQLIPHFGGLAFAVWLVIHHTTVTMPNILKDHRAERLEIILEFKKERSESLAEFHRLLDEKQNTYTQLLESQMKQFKEAQLKG